MISFTTHDVQLPEYINETTKLWIAEVINSYGYQPGELTYVFCSDNYILEVNKQYLNHDYYTDIITFDYCKGTIVSGDLLISLDTVKSNGSKYADCFKDELHRVVIHGILHLLGYKDATDEEKADMRQREDEALSLLSTFH